MAGRRNRYGYQEYRGRSGVRSVLIFIIALLAVLLAAGAAVLIFFGDYIKYTDAGIEIDLPWRGGESAPPPEITDPVVIETDEVVITVEPEPTPTPTPEPQYEAIGAVTVTTAQLRDGSAAAAVAAAGGNALVVEMKAATGRLAWQSQSALASSLWADAADNATAQAVRSLAETSQLYLVARVHCFRDPLLANARVGTIMTRGGNVWYDRVGVCWSSPANQQAADYISALCLQLADMGFDEILLDDAGYPDDGQVNVLAVSDNRPEDLTGPVSAFFGRLAGELEEKGVCLSIQTTEAALRGDNTLSGVTAGVLAQHAGRVWLPAAVSGTDYRAVLTAAGLEDADVRVVVESAAAGSWYR